METGSKVTLGILLGAGLVGAVLVAGVAGGVLVYVLRSPPPREVGPQAPVGVAEAPRVRTGGRFTGRILGADGGPVRVEGARATVSISGVTGRGENADFSPPVAADGSFDLKLIEGIYHPPRAELRVPFDGRTFRYALHPVPLVDGDTPSEQGIARDFVWRVSGPRPGREPDPTDHTRWYGASVCVTYQFYRDDVKKPVPAPPVGTKVTFTLLPQGRLIDGSEGKPLTFERGYDRSFTGLDNKNLPDVPIGRYSLGGFETHPDGSRRPLLMQKAYAEFVESVEVRFQPHDVSSPYVMVGFTRP